MLAGAFSLLFLGNLAAAQDEAKDLDLQLCVFERDPELIALRRELMRHPGKAYAINKKIAEINRGRLLAGLRKK